MAQRYSIHWVRLPVAIRFGPGGSIELAMPGLGVRSPLQRSGRTAFSLWNGSSPKTFPVAFFGATELPPLHPLVAAALVGSHKSDGSFGVSTRRELRKDGRTVLRHVATFSLITDLRSLPFLWWLQREIGGGTIYTTASDAPPTEGDATELDYRRRQESLSFTLKVTLEPLLRRLVEVLGPLVWDPAKRAQLAAVAKALGMELPPLQPRSLEQQHAEASFTGYGDGTLTAQAAGRLGAVTFSVGITQVTPATVDWLVGLYGTERGYRVGAGGGKTSWAAESREGGHRWAVFSRRNVLRWLRHHEEVLVSLAAITGNPLSPDRHQKDARAALLRPFYWLSSRRAYHRSSLPQLRQLWLELARR